MVSAEDNQRLGSDRMIEGSNPDSGKSVLRLLSPWFRGGRNHQHPFSRMRLEKQGPVQCVVGIRTFKIYDNAEPIS